MAPKTVGNAPFHLDMDRPPVRLSRQFMRWQELVQRPIGRAKDRSPGGVMILMTYTAVQLGSF